MNEKDLLRREMDKQGMLDNELRAGTAALVLGESGFESRSETPYRNTSNDRIRRIFASRLGNRSDDFIDQLKSNDERFFNYVYGPAFNHIHNLGQRAPDDGWRFRGRGTVQLTGRANYEKLSSLLGIDLIENPDCVNEPEIAAAVTVAYMLWRYKGGGWSGMKRAVGISRGRVDTIKNQAFERFRRTGEFDYRADPAIHQNIAERLKQLQNSLRDAGFYRGIIDGQFGPLTEGALWAWQRNRRRT